MDHAILHLGRPTVGDAAFYDRWRVFGEVYPGWDRKQEALDRATIIVVDQHQEVTDKFLETFKRLKFVCSPTTGHTHLKFDPQNRGVILVTLRGEKDFLAGIWSVAEFTIYLMLRLARQTLPGRLLRGKTLGIIGHGRIGIQVESLARAFGVRVYSYDKMSTKAQLSKLFAFCDFISIHLEENDDTKGLITKDLIFSMRKTSYLINTARASIVDNAALYQALKTGGIAGAASDVWDGGITHDRLILTPHVAGATIEDRITTDEFLVQKLLSFLETGQPRRVRDSG